MATTPTLEKAFCFGADANAFGGILSEPAGSVLIPTAGSVSLSHGGGSATCPPAPASMGGISVRSTHSEVMGQQVGGPGSDWETVLTSEIEDLDILGIVTAAKLTCKITVRHPYQDPPYYPSVSFAECNFWGGLMVNGKSVHPVLTTSQYDRSASDVAESQCSWFDDVTMLSRVEGQTNKLLHQQPPIWLDSRYCWMTKENSRRAKGHIRCSLVTGFNPDGGLKSFGHVLEVQNLGYLFLGELIADHTSFNITMLRAELVPEWTKDSEVRRGKGPLGGTVVVACGHTKGIPSP